MAFTPEVMSHIGCEKYITIIPTTEFQISHYKNREWVPYVLKDCIDKEKAFDNWMKRGLLFAKQVEKECRQRDITCIVNDGSRTVDTINDIVKKSLGLE